MRILAVNPNTSTAVTDAFVTEARRIAPPDVSVDGVTGTFGATIVSCEAENVVAAHSALDLIAAHAAGYDAVILAISFDSGLLAAQELLPVPVVGLTHAACLAAGVEDRPVGVIGFGAVSLPLYQRTIHGHGFRPMAFEAVEIASPAAYLTPGAMDRAVLKAVERLATAGAEAVAIIGTAIVGMAARLASETATPLYDGAAALPAAVAAVRGGGGSGAAIEPLGDAKGLSADLAALIGGRWPRATG